MQKTDRILPAFQLVRPASFTYYDQDNRDLKDLHTCEMFLRGCIDWRIHQAVSEFVKNILEVRDYDYSGYPGGVKKIVELGEQRPGILGWLSWRFWMAVNFLSTLVTGKEHDFGTKTVLLSCRLHGVKSVVLVAHEDCGAYGGSKSFANYEAERTFHIAQMKKAVRVIEQMLRMKRGGCTDHEGNVVEMTYVLLWAHFVAGGKGVNIERVAEGAASSVL